MAKRKKILIVVDWYLPAVKAGGPVRSIAAIVERLKSEFDFAIVTSDRDLGDVQPYEGIELDQWITAPDGTRTWYIHRLSPFNVIFAEILKEELPDYVYVNGIFSEFSRNAIRLAKKRSIPVLVAPRGMLGKGALEIKSLKKKLFLRFAKFTSLFAGVSWHASSEQEKLEIREKFPDAAVKVALNLALQTSSTRQHSTKIRDQLNVIFLSRISPKKNLDYALQALNETNSSSQISLDIYGPIEDEEYWKLCLKTSRGAPPHVKVVYHHAIAPEKIGDAMARADLFVFPTLHENFGHVILESLSCGVPVLISDQTPWRNLTKDKAGWDLALSDPKGFAAIIDKVAAMDESELAEWRRGAKEFASRYSNDEKLVELNRNLFN